jgi:hypothetical protein
MELTTARFAERTKGFVRARNVVDGYTFPISTKIKVPAKTTLVLQLVN